MPNGIPKRKVAKLIRNTEVRVSEKDLLKAWKDSLGQKLDTVVFDSKYWGVPLATWEMILKYSGIDSGQYRSDRYDCDDFAIAFRAEVSKKFSINGCGIVVDLSGGHAYNALLVTEGQELSIRFLEPQNDKLIITPKGQYRMTKGYVIF